MSDDLVKRYRQLQEVIGGCHDGYCVVRKPKGMHTNGGCNCLEDLRLHERSRIGGLLRCAQGMADRIEELEAKLDWVIVERDETFALMLDRAQTAEAKLEKVVVVLQGMESDMKGLDYYNAYFICKDLIAELTGGNDE